MANINSHVCSVDWRLRLQASLDGEVVESESEPVARTLGRDPKEVQLLTELVLVKSVLTGNEPLRRVPLSRERYWSQIERAIRSKTLTRAAGE